MPNRLAKETSPYLLQHQDNPVDWFPWGDEALQKARDEDKPIFLSIGYSACHWCHVMERESFENEEIAALMNEKFVNIKVDREERPDVDSIYMSAVQAMTGRGGWPMSVFISPDGRPFYAGTYFPPEDRGGLPAFPTVLNAIAEGYGTRREELLASSDKVVEALGAQALAPASAEPLTRDLIGDAYRGLAGGFDGEHGGFGGAPKFPSPMIYEFLLRYWHATGDPKPLAMVELTLDKMARGGMYDQVGGGFHRYSTDELWLVPHFEKMLYDNALLAQLYLHAWQATGKPAYRRIVEETLRYVEREMIDPAGGFYSAQDADSEGEEGRFFVWDGPEIDEVLGDDLGRIARAYYDVTDAPNFEGRHILWRPDTDEEVATELNITVDALQEAIAQARPKLLAARERRVRPARDDKVLTSWNALMMKAFAEAGAALENETYIQIARRNAEFVLGSLQRDGRLLRTWKASDSGGEAKLNGYLEDHAYLIDALVSLYEATFEQRWLEEAAALAKRMVELFWDDDKEVFFDTGHDHEQLLVRPRDVFDNATPSGGSAAAVALLRLALFTSDVDFQRRGVAAIRTVRDMLARAPSGFAHWLAALDFYLSTPKEVVIIGARDDPATRALLRTAYTRYLPNRAIAGADAPVDRPATPLLEERALVDGKPTAYVCENYTCQQPVTDREALAAQLDA
ncbi:MAG: thioredoxin domain-containing protein [Chloroflexi bacterium]|nr:thioredoxin domain-containing protein [Chloroflexota bacterium]